MTDIHDIKPVLKIGMDPAIWMWGLLAIGLLILLAMGFYWWRRRKRSKNEHLLSVPPIPPDQQAFEALDALAAESDTDAKAFYFRLSAILRRYIEGRYGIAAAEMTSEELIPAVARLEWPRPLNRDLREFCHATDPVKFADRPARRDKMVKDLAFVRRVVDQTRPREATAEEHAGPDRPKAGPKERESQASPPRIGHTPQAPTTEEA